MPIKPGAIIETTITRIGLEGDGVGSYEGLHVIVPKTAVGDKVSCEVKYTTKDRIHTNIVDVLAEGNSRVAPPCKYYKSCGGCGLQHINAEEYKNYKISLLTTALKNNNITFPESIPWFSVGENSRRRAFIRFYKNTHLQKGGDAYRLGFYEHQSHNVIDIKQCLILEPELQLLLAPLKELSITLGINIEGWMITNTDSGIDLTLHSDDIKIKNEAFVFKTLASFAKNFSFPVDDLNLSNSKGISNKSGEGMQLPQIPLTITPEASQGETGLKIARIAWKRGKKFILVTENVKPALTISGREIILPEEYFLQAAKSGQKAILDAVVPHVDDGTRLLDLFSGLGIYSFALADKVKSASAYEISPEMVEAMEENINRHKLGEKISAYCRDIEAFPLGRDELAKFDTAIINPPRTGALKQVAVLAVGGLKKIIMVSCNSSTFARDAQILNESGYSLKSLSAIDQFYYSHHLEQVGVFIKN